MKIVLETTIPQRFRKKHLRMVVIPRRFSKNYLRRLSEIELQEIVNGLINTQMYNSPRILIALLFITVGIGFKLSPAPSHQWTPILNRLRSECIFNFYISPSPLLNFYRSPSHSLTPLLPSSVIPRFVLLWNPPFHTIVATPFTVGDSSVTEHHRFVRSLRFQI